MIKISKRAEDLLREILEHRDEKGNCNTTYWKDRFDSLSVADDALLRSLFKELREAEMISTSWADNYPYIILILGNGISYFEEKQREEMHAKRSDSTNIFYGNISGLQIQQGTTYSKQDLSITQSIDEKSIVELVEMIRKYDTMLDNEYGTERADKIRESAKNLEEVIATNKPVQTVRGVLEYIRDLSVNAGGGLIAAGIFQFVSNLLR